MRKFLPSLFLAAGETPGEIPKIQERERLRRNVALDV